MVPPLSLTRQTNCNNYFRWALSVMKMRKITDQHHFRYQRHFNDPRRPFSRPALKVISADVEGLSNSKEQLLATISKNQNCDVLCLKETHCRITNNLCRVHGMTLAVERPHSKEEVPFLWKLGASLNRHLWLMMAMSKFWNSN